MKESGTIDNLREVLRFHEYRYYVLNDPLISDSEYDQIYKKLEAMEKADPSLITKGEQQPHVTKTHYSSRLLKYLPALSIFEQIDALITEPKHFGRNLRNIRLPRNETNDF